MTNTEYETLYHEAVAADNAFQAALACQFGTERGRSERYSDGSNWNADVRAADRLRAQLARKWTDAMYARRSNERKN